MTTEEPEAITLQINVSSERDRISGAQTRHRFNQDRILTSRDEAAIAMMNELVADDLTPGFQGELIPILFERETVEYDVLARVGVRTPLHNHPTAGFHQILSGRVRVMGQGMPRPVDLTVGDWVYVPADTDYTLEILENVARLRYKH